jgi:hypothetical protein
MKSLLGMTALHNNIKNSGTVITVPPQPTVYYTTGRDDKQTDIILSNLLPHSSYGTHNQGRTNPLNLSCVIRDISRLTT